MFKKDKSLLEVLERIADAYEALVVAQIEHFKSAGDSQREAARHHGLSCKVREEELKRIKLLNELDSARHGDGGDA